VLVAAFYGSYPGFVDDSEKAFNLTLAEMKVGRRDSREYDKITNENG
jgi:hypothetical protein